MMTASHHHIASCVVAVHADEADGEQKECSKKNRCDDRAEWNRARATAFESDKFSPISLLCIITTNFHFVKNKTVKKKSFAPRFSTSKKKKVILLERPQK
jgi:hypothetical protein